MATLTFILFFFWAGAMLLSIWACEVARMFARRIAKAAASPPETPENPPSVALIIPIKGIEEDTAENLRALLKLTYPRLRYLFSLESEQDPVLPLIRQLTAALPAAKAEIIIAGPSTTRGQKIHNQLAAIARTTAADQILVFMDADAQPHNHWLNALVAPLSDPEVGASTGYRLYVPAVKKSAAHLASAEVSVINATIAALLGPSARNQAWGGSMALTRENFFNFGIHDAWQNALSDDYVLTRQVKRVHKKTIRFVHSCFVPSSANFNWRSFFEFAPRQYKITRVCAPAIWATAVFGTFLYFVAFTYPLILWAVDLALGIHDNHLLLMFAAIYLANLIRGLFLLRGSKIALPRYAGRLQGAAFWYTWGFPLFLYVNLLALLKSAFGRTIRWRGITYTMHSPTQTTVHRPAPSPAIAPVSPSPALAEEPAQLIAK